MPQLCTICHHGEREKIDRFLKQGRVLASLALKYSVTESSLKRHKRSHLGIEPASKAPQADSAAVVEPVEAAPIRDAEAVHSQLEWIIAKSRAMHAEAEASKDWRLANTAMTQIVNALDKIAKSVGMYQDGGTTINIDARTQKVAAFYDTLPDETLRRLAAGEISIEAVMEATKEAVA